MPRRPVRSGALVLRKTAPITSSPSMDTDQLTNSITSLTLNTPLTPLRPKRHPPPQTPIPFLTLPSELRIKIYESYFDDDDPNDVIDLDPDNYKRFHKKLGLMRVCKQIHAEATHLFYSTRTFRIFPTFPGKYFKTKRVLLSRMKTVQRECMTSLQLRLGPGWDAPPRGWVVSDALGLVECGNVQRLKVFVECDPSDGVFKGFQRSEGFYGAFSRKLLKGVLDSLPAVEVIEFDAWRSVKKHGAMMRGLLDVAACSGRIITWGPERGWTDHEEKEDKVIEKPPYDGMEGFPILGYTLVTA